MTTGSRNASNEVLQQSRVKRLLDRLAELVRFGSVDRDRLADELLEQQTLERLERINKRMEDRANGHEESKPKGC